MKAVYGQAPAQTMTSDKNKRNAWLIFDGLILLALLTVGMTSNAATILCTLLLAGSFFFKKEAYVVAELFFFYSFYNLFKLGGTGVSYYNFLMAAAIIVLLIKNPRETEGEKREIKLSTTFQRLFFLFVYIVVVGVFQNTSDLFSTLVDLIIPLLLVFCVIRRKDSVNIKWVVYAFAASTIIAGLCGSGIIPVSDLDKYVTGTTAYRIAGIRLIRVQGFTVNPNYFSLDVNIAMAGVLVLPMLQRKKTSLLEVALMLALLVIGLMTLSKSFILGVFATLFVFFLFNIKQAKAYKFAFAAVFILAVVYMLGGAESAYLSAIIDRFTASTDVDSLTSSRSSIWQEYVEYLFANPLTLLFGEGIMNTMRASHNFYLECLYTLGVFGSGLLLFFLNGLRGKCKVGGGNINRYIPLVVFLVRAFAINLLLRESFFLFLIYIFLFIGYAEKQTEAKEMEGVLT